MRSHLPSRSAISVHGMPTEEARECDPLREPDPFCNGRFWGCNEGQLFRQDRALKSASVGQTGAWRSPLWTSPNSHTDARTGSMDCIIATAADESSCVVG